MDKLPGVFAVRFLWTRSQSTAFVGSPAPGRAVEAVTPVAGAAGRNGTGQGNMSEKGTVMGTLPANVGERYPGSSVYLPSFPSFSGKNVNPQIVENYRGGDIALGIGDEVLSPVMFPVLHQLWDRR